MIIRKVENVRESSTDSVMFTLSRLIINKLRRLVKHYYLALQRTACSGLGFRASFVWHFVIED